MHLCFSGRFDLNSMFAHQSASRLKKIDEIPLWNCRTLFDLSTSFPFGNHAPNFCLTPSRRSALLRAGFPLEAL